MRFSFAASGGNDMTTMNRDTGASKLSSQEMTVAQELASGCQSKKLVGRD